MTTLYTTLTPRLIVQNAETALAFYEQVFAAKRGMCISTPSGQVVHAELDLGGLRMSVTEADGEHNRDPESLGGSAVILTWLCDDADALMARAKAAGAETVFPVEDRYYGMRDGRFRDPNGHLWLVTQPLEHLSPEELQKRTADPR
ncbi:MAG: VOC family protein [Myxococcota bacterium]